MSLEAWQVRLQTHFRDLQQRRSITGGNMPVFALEHGLGPAELKALEGDIRTDCARLRPSRGHALAWVVYASEIGYRYAGDEYWQTFEESTPGWTERGDRYWIQRIFRNFHSEYGGAKPTGRFADSFSIICWPIHHAILPKDLQRQLAWVLFRARHSFSVETFASPAGLGKLIKAYSRDTNSRFQNLVEDSLLVGQIATALLLQDQQGFISLIHPDTLERIREDLEGEWQARDWLREARTGAQQVRMRGLSRPRTESRQTTLMPIVQQAREQVAALGIEPRLSLYPTKSSSWEVVLEIPNFTNLLTKFDSFYGVLTESRCTVAGYSGRPLARGRVLYGSQQVNLHKWPDSDEVMLQFERAPRELDLLLRTECLLRPGPIWLFKISSDGIAHEIRSLIVRPGNQYILLSKSSPIGTLPWVIPTAVECEGIDGALLDVPLAIPSELMKQFERLGLQQPQTVEVWPAGLVAANWDGEGQGEWLSTEQPSIGIRTDYPVDVISVSLDGNDIERLDIVPGRLGDPVFVELPMLPVGVHKLLVSTRTGFQEESGQLDLRIREPRAWSPGANIQGVLTFLLDPPKPTLEDVWEGRLALEIHGPSSRHISCTVNLFDKHSIQPIVRVSLPPLQLPVKSASWQDHFDKNVRSLHDIWNNYDNAYSCEINFDAEELGTFVINSVREFSPLRWQVLRDNRGYMLRLLDDTGASASLEMYRYDFDSPDVAVPIEFAAFLKDFAKASRGLYLALLGASQRGIIVPQAGLTALSQLSVHPQVASRTRTTGSIIDLLSLIEHWSDARLTGDSLCPLWQRQVLVALVQQLFGLIGGRDWGQAEKYFSVQRNQHSLEYLKRTLEKGGLGEALFLESAKLLDVSVRERADRFYFIVDSSIRPPALGAVSQDLGRSRWLCEFALRLASSPEGITKWSGNRLEAGVLPLLHHAEVALAARFLVLSIDLLRDSNRVEVGRLYTGWEWQ